jgi:hypothetical protein
MSVDTLSRVFRESRTEMAERLVLLVLADRADQCDTCYPSYDDIAARANVHKDSARRIVERLIESQEVLPRYRVGRSTCYMVTCGKDKKQIEADVRKAWGLSMADLMAQNGVATARTSQASGSLKGRKTKTGHPLTQDHRVDPLIGDHRVSKSQPIDPPSEPIDPQSVDPLIGDHSEPSLEPSDSELELDFEVKNARGDFSSWLESAEANTLRRTFREEGMADKAKEREVLWRVFECQVPADVVLSRMTILRSQYDAEPKLTYWPGWWIAALQRDAGDEAERQYRREHNLPALAEAVQMPP